MANVKKMSIALTPEMAAMVRQAVATGEYASSSEIMREALREWKRRRNDREQAVAELGRLWDDGVASGPLSPIDEAFDRIRDKLAKIQTGP